MEWDFLRNKQYSPFLKDDNYSVLSIETFTKGCCEHHTGNVRTFFKGNKIDILYKDEDIITAIMVFLVRLVDPYFKFSHVLVNNKKFFFEQKKEYVDDSVVTFLLDEKEIFYEIGYENFKFNKITIVCDSVKSFNYAKSTLVYEVFSDKEDTYYLNKELDRWSQNS